MNVNEYKDSSECMVTVTNEPISLQLPPFIRVIVDCERVDNIMLDVVLDSPPPFEDLAWLLIESSYTTLPQVTASALFGNVIRIQTPYFKTSTDPLLLGAFLYKDHIFCGTDKIQFYNHLQFGHYDEAFNKILKDCNLPYYYKYGKRMEL